MSLRSTKESQVIGKTESNRTVITGVFDQAALHGLLRRIYALGFPLVSVNQVTNADTD